ncbi:hypothetical protein PBRA_007622 [Plasmodiophora brassicae]|uniref:Uncharacterized protein n=1 Tax=Plasmodiophora brassicae TaxID=37360 RepID=A0A0G4IX12_PLABS|nr:hypothetical protein PBRA_007622 [Plasmodiophora brassicae]
MAVAVDGGPQRQRRGPLILVVIVLLASAITTAARYLLLPILPLRAAGAFQRFAPQPLTSRDALRHCVPGFLLGLFCVAVACLPAVIIAVVVQMALNLSHVTMLYILSGALPVLTVLYAIAVQFESATECLSLPSVVLHSLAAAFLDPVLFVLGIVVVAFRRDRLLAQGSQSMNQWRLSVVAQFGWCMADLCVLPAVLFCALLPWRFGHLLAQRKAHLADGRDLDALVVPLVQVLRLLNDLPYLAVGMVAVVTVYRALPFINGLWDSYSARDYKWTSFRSTCLTHAWYVICDVPVFLCAGICLVFVWRVVLLVRERDGDMRKRVVHHALLALCDLPVFCIALPVVLLTVYRVRNLKAGPKSGDLHLCIVAEFVAFLIDAPFMILSSVLIVLPYRIPLLFAEIRRSTTNWKARQAVLVEIRETLLDLLCLIPALLCLAFAWRLPALLQNLLKPIPASRRRTLVGVGSVLGICDIATVIPGLILLVTVYRTRYAWKRINDRRREPGGPFSPHAVIWRNGLIATVEFPVAVAGLGLLLALAVWRVPSLASIWSNSAVPANKKRVALGRHLVIGILDWLCLPLFIVLFATVYRWPARKIRALTPYDGAPPDARPHRVCALEFLQFLLDVPCLIPVPVYIIWRYRALADGWRRHSGDDGKRRWHLVRQMYLSILDVIAFLPALLLYAVRRTQIRDRIGMFARWTTSSGAVPIEPKDPPPEYPIGNVAPPSVNHAIDDSRESPRPGLAAEPSPIDARSASVAPDPAPLPDHVDVPLPPPDYATAVLPDVWEVWAHSHRVHAAIANETFDGLVILGRWMLITIPLTVARSVARSLLLTACFVGSCVLRVSWRRCLFLYRIAQAQAHVQAPAAMPASQVQPSGSNGGHLQSPMEISGRPAEQAVSSAARVGRLTTRAQLVIVGSEVWELLLDLTVIPLALIVVLEVIRAQRLFDLFVSNLDIPNGTRRYRVVALFADTVLDVVLVATLPLALLFPWRLHKLVRRAPYAENLSGVGFRTRFFMHIRDGTFDVPFAILFILLLPTWRCPIVVKRIWGQRNRTDLQDVRRVSDSNRNAVQSSPVDVRRCIGSEFVSLVLDIVALTSIAIVVVLPVVLVVLFHAATAVTAVIFLLCGCRLLLVCRDVRFCNWDAVRVRSVLYTSALLGVLDAPCFVMALLGLISGYRTSETWRLVLQSSWCKVDRQRPAQRHDPSRGRAFEGVLADEPPASAPSVAPPGDMRPEGSPAVGPDHGQSRHASQEPPNSESHDAVHEAPAAIQQGAAPALEPASAVAIAWSILVLGCKVVIDIPFLLLFILLIVTGWRSSEAMRQYSTKKGNLPRAAFALQFCNLVIDLPVISAALILTLWAHRTRGMWKAVANAPSASDRRPIIGKHMIVACADVLALPFLAVNIVTLYRLEGLRLRILGLLHSDGSLHDELRPHWNFLVSSGQIVADIPHLIMAVIVTFTWRSRSLWNELLAIRRARRCFEPAQGTERPPPGYREPAPSAPNVDVVESVAVEIPSDAQRDVAPPPDHLALDVSASHDVNHSVEPPPYESPAQQDDTKQLALRSYREPIQQEFAGTCVDIPFVIAGALAAILLHRSVCLILDLGRCSSAKERRKAAVLNLALFFVDAVAAVLFIVPILATGFRLPRTCRDIANVAMFPPALSLEERVRPHAVILRECWAAVVGTSTAVVFIAIALPAMALCLWRLPTLVAFIRAGRPLISSAFMMWMFYVLDVVALLEMAVISSLVVRCHCFWSACHTIVRQFREWQSCESVEARTAFVEQLDERQRFQNALNDYFGTHEGNVQSGASLTLVWDIVSEEFSRSLLSIPFIIMLPFNILGYVLLPPYYLAKYRVNGPKHWQSYLVRPLRYVITHCPEPRSIAKMDRFFAYNFIVTLPCVIFDMIAVAAAVPHVAVIHASCWTFAKVKVPLERDAAEANAVAAAEQHPFTANTLFQAVIFPVLAVLECSFVGLPVATFFLTRAYRFCAVATAVHASVWAVIAPATIQLANQYRVALQRQAVFAPWRLWVAIGRASFLCVPCRLVLDTVVLGPLRAVTRVCWRISQQGGLIGELVGEILFMGFLVAWVAWPLLLFLANTIAGICGVFLTLALVVTSVRPVKESWGPPVDGH